MRYKRPAFKHEKEWRFAIYHPTDIELAIKLAIEADRELLNEWETLCEVFSSSKPPVITYKICIDDLQEVLLDPRSIESHNDTFKKYCQNRGFDKKGIKFEKSLLYTM